MRYRPKVPNFYCTCLVMSERIHLTGLNCTNRIFISDRAQLVFDFHQIVDGLKEVELGLSRYLFLSCSPLHHDLRSSALERRRKALAQRTRGKPRDLACVCIIYSTMNILRKSFARLLRDGFKRYGQFEYDTEGEIQRYKVGSL
jgi:adenylosuccinate synthase